MHLGFFGEVGTILNFEKLSKFAEDSIFLKKKNIFILLKGIFSKARSKGGKYAGVGRPSCLPSELKLTYFKVSKRARR